MCLLSFSDVKRHRIIFQGKKKNPAVTFGSQNKFFIAHFFIFFKKLVHQIQHRCAAHLVVHAAANKEITGADIQS